jgi:shikimate dehydrogenase
MKGKKEFGLIGYPLDHSFSEAYFREKFRHEGLQDCVYTSHPIKDIRQFPEFIRNHPELAGLNVTIPHKESIIPYLNELDDVAEEVNAVNAIAIEHRSSGPWLKGYNTDVTGFYGALHPFEPAHFTHALVLGTGGASRAICHVLHSLSLDVLKVSRSGQGPGIISFSEVDAAIMARYTLIVNTTPLGTWPDVEACPPIPYDHVSAEHYLFDLVYNPGETLFLRKGKQNGARIKNGLQMLEIQAEASWDIWMASR